MESLYKGHTIGVVVPAYKEELLIWDTLKSIPHYIDRIYAVNDASPDRTGEIIDEYANQDIRTVAIHKKQNCGVGNAILTGYKQAYEDGMDIAVVMAGDNQMDPQYLPNLLEPIINNQAEYTKGNRLSFKKFLKGMSLWRRMGNFILTCLTRVASGYWGMTDPQNGYTAISRKVLESEEIYSTYPGYGYCNHLLVLLNILGFRVKDIPIPAKYGKEKSGICYRTYIPTVSMLLLSCFIFRVKGKYIKQSFHPLVIFYLIGSCFTILGILTSTHNKFFSHLSIWEWGGNPIHIILAGTFFIAIAVFCDFTANEMHD